MFGEGLLGEVDIAPARIVDAPGAADHVRLGELRPFLQAALDRRFVGVAELVAVGPEQLDAVVRERIVRGRDHHAQIRAHRPRVSIATAGVGIGPSSTTSMPTLVKPATIADSIM